MQGSDTKKKKGSIEVPFVQGKKTLTDAKGNKTGSYQITKKKKKRSIEVPFVQGKKTLTDAKGNKTGFYQITTKKVVKQRPKSHKGGR